jgi:hypothetical protein
MRAQGEKRKKNRGTRKSQAKRLKKLGKLRGRETKKEPRTAENKERRRPGGETEKNLGKTERRGDPEQGTKKRQEQRKKTESRGDDWRSKRDRDRNRGREQKANVPQLRLHLQNTNTVSR